MVRVGAKGQTARELDEVLELPSDQTDNRILSSIYAELLEKYHLVKISLYLYIK